MDKSYHHGDLGKSLIEAGVNLINNEGLKQLSLRKVAALCNVSHTAPYSHFKNKEELLEAMQNYVTKKFMFILDNIVQTNEKDNPNILGKLGEAYILFFIENPQYYTFLFCQGNIKINLSLNDNNTENFAPFQLFKKLSINILSSMNFSEEKIQDEIISMWATVHGIASIATMKGVTYDKDWKTKIKDIFCIQHGGANEKY